MTDEKNLGADAAAVESAGAIASDTAPHADRMNMAKDALLDAILADTDALLITSNIRQKINELIAAVIAEVRGDY